MGTGGGNLRVANGGPRPDAGRAGPGGGGVVWGTGFAVSINAPFGTNRGPRSRSGDGARAVTGRAAPLGRPGGGRAKRQGDQPDGEGAGRRDNGPGGEGLRQQGA